MKKFGVLFVAMLVALGLVGATYAYWSDSLSISGSVSTGNLDVKLNSTTQSSDSDDTMQYNVGSVTCSVDPNDDDRATVTITDAYPDYQATCTFTIENTGTIPAKIMDISVTDNSGNPLDTSVLDVTVNGLSEGDVIEAGASQMFKVVTTVGQNAAEGASYSYTITIDVGQFNEELG